ncbi:nidogen-like domain-containing protein [Azospirillum sp. SYSU D00513]|uniref:nidogen-like domain-containing protein n=1 Tax=Azospirillum sp. SYSU D00513 TaxID=2812561 RepID=UPI001A977A06|nr:nidogen-like domain-containing protein [Azospirillum sp. SYSU D00513]
MKTRFPLSRLVQTSSIALAVGVCMTAGGVQAGAVLDTGVNYVGTLPANDDGSSAPVPIGFTANIWGGTRSAVYVNNNGNFTFDQAISTYTPSPLNTVGRDIVAPFWADVDTRNGGTVQYGQTSVNGRTAFVTTWNEVAYYGGGDKRNTFQAVLVDRSDRQAGDFDIQLNYNQIQWESGTASGGAAGLGGSSARAGYSSADGTHSFELPGSGQPGSFLDQAVTALIRQSNTDVPGRYVFEVSGGQVQLVEVIVDNHDIEAEAQAATLSEVTQQSERSTVGETVRTITSRIGDVLRSRMAARQRNAEGASAFGMSAGDGTGRISGWVDGNVSFLRNFNSGSRFNGRNHTGLFGADYRVSDNFVVGGAVGVEHSRFDLLSLNGRRTGRGYSFTPYVGYVINDYLTVDASLSYGYNDNDVRQNLLGRPSTGDYDSRRLVASTNLSGYYVQDAWTFRGVTGLSVSRTRSDSYLDSAGNSVSPGVNDLRQFRIGAEAEYQATDIIRPFVGATLEYDLLNRTREASGAAMTSTNGDRSGIIGTVGVRVDALENLSLTGQLSYQALRANERDTTVGVSARLTF